MNYPDEATLRAIFAELSTEKTPKDDIRKRLRRLDLETFERALEQLWVHRGVIIDPEENTWFVGCLIGKILPIAT